MVVIGQQENEDRNTNPSKAGAANDVSDGFETASDTDLGSDGDGNDGRPIIREEPEHQEHQHQQKQTEQEQEQEQGDPQKSISSEDASIDEEELKQVRFRNLGFC